MSIITILIGNKLDKKEERAVSKEEAMEWAENHNMGYIETSALSNQNVDMAFVLLSTCNVIYIFEI